MAADKYDLGLPPKRPKPEDGKKLSRKIDEVRSGTHATLDLTEEDLPVQRSSRVKQARPMPADATRVAAEPPIRTERRPKIERKVVSTERRPMVKRSKRTTDRRE